MSAYAELESKTREITRLKEIQAITGWDEACMMPVGGGQGRSQAMATLTSIIHERLCDPEIGELLNKVRGDGTELDAWQSTNLSNIERQFVEATAVPAELVRANRLATPLALAGPFAIEDQRKLCEDVMGVLGFDFQRGRFDVSHHPLRRIELPRIADGHLPSNRARPLSAGPADRLA